MIRADGMMSGVAMPSLDLDDGARENTFTIELKRVNEPNLAS